MSDRPAVAGKHSAQNRAAQEEAPLEWQPGLRHRFKAAGSGACCTGGEQAKGCRGQS